MKKDLDYYMNLPYTIEIIRIPDSQGGGFSARLPEVGRLARSEEHTSELQSH